MQTFSQLFSASWSGLRSLSKPFLIGALIVSAILLIGQFTLHQTALDFMGGARPEKLEELSERMAMGDEKAMDEMMEMMGLNAGGELSDEQAGLMVAEHVLKGLAPAMGSFAILFILVTVLAKAYYLVVAADAQQDPVSALKRACGIIFPLIGIALWIMIRSFVWIPVIGIVTGIILMPRFSFAPLIYLREGGGVLSAVRESYARTRGYWGRIVGYMLLLMFSLILAMIVIGIAGKILSVVPLLSVAAVTVAQQLLICFSMVFYVRFGTDILSHPLVPAAAPVREAVPQVAPAKKTVVKKAPAKKSAPKKKPVKQTAKRVTTKKTPAKKKK